MQQEKTMKKSTKIALAFLALASTAGTVTTAMAQEGRRGGGMRFEQTDADSSGDITFEEFAAAMKRLDFARADADRDGKATLGEIADEIERMRAERVARRIVERFDANGDGALTAAEIESRQRKMFALMDRNDDGKVVKEEMPRRWHGRRGGYRPEQ
jgi:Ca2+-binding EF-hand superfamily protein